MRIVAKRVSARDRAAMRQAGSEALRAARLAATMKGAIVYVPIGAGGGQAGSRRSRMGVLCDARVGFDPKGTEYRSYYLKRLPPFAITRLTPIQRWAFMLVHESRHIAQRPQGPWSELEAERSVLKAQAKLGWGALELLL